jgi:hypothetical protein
MHGWAADVVPMRCNLVTHPLNSCLCIQAAVLLLALVPRLADRCDLWPVLVIFHELFWDRVTHATASPPPGLSSNVPETLQKLISGIRSFSHACKTESPRSEMTPLCFYTSVSAAVARPQLALLLATLGTACCRGGDCRSHSTVAPLAALRAALETPDFLGQRLAALAADECTQGPRTQCRQLLARALAIQHPRSTPTFQEPSVLLDPKLHGKVIDLLDPRHFTRTSPPWNPPWNLLPPERDNAETHAMQQARVGHRFVAAIHLTFGRFDSEIKATSFGSSMEFSLSLSNSPQASVVISACRKPMCQPFLPNTQLRLAAVPAAAHVAEALVKAAVAWGHGMGGPLEAPTGPTPPRPWIVHRRVSFSSEEPHRAFAEVEKSELTEIGVVIAEKASVLVVFYGEAGDLDSRWPQRPASAWIDDWAPALQIHCV